jgi:hypothetical protein
MTFLVIPIYDNALNSWMKFNTEEEWKVYAFRLLPENRAYRSPHKFPCYVKVESEMNNNNGTDYMFHTFIYDFKEKEVCEGEECDEAFTL